MLIYHQITTRLNLFELCRDDRAPSPFQHLADARCWAGQVVGHDLAHVVRQSSGVHEARRAGPEKARSANRRGVVHPVPDVNPMTVQAGGLHGLECLGAGQRGRDQLDAFADVGRSGRGLVTAQLANSLAGHIGHGADDQAQGFKVRAQPGEAGGLQRTGCGPAGAGVYEINAGGVAGQIHLAGRHVRLEFYVPAGEGGAGQLLKECAFLFHDDPLIEW